MAPVFSRLRPGPLPDDVLRIIASLLPVHDLKNLITSCKACHSAGTPVLYRSVETWFVPLHFFDHVAAADNRPVEFLATLINSAAPSRSLSIPSRCYAAHVVTLCYGSWSMPCDFRALPLLAEALRFTHRLRHLRIDVGSATVPILLDILRRASIIITPSTILATSTRFDRYPLPCLQSIRCSRIAVADALMRYRPIKTVAVELSIKQEVLAQFLRADAPWNPRHLLQLSLNVGGYACSQGLLRSILIAFPQLQHLAVRTSSLRARDFMEDALGTLASGQEVGQSLHALIVNHASFYPNYGSVLQELESVFKGGFRDRPALREVVMGDSMWTREDEYTDWSFVEFPQSFLTHWPWLQYPSEGEWGTRGEAVNAFYSGLPVRIRIGAISTYLTWPLKGVLTGAIRPYDARHAQGITHTLLSRFEQLLLVQKPEAIDNICFCWTPDVLFKIRRLSSATFYAIEAYFCRQWNINLHLRRWFTDVPDFLRQLGTFDGLIAGSEALSFFDRRRFLGRDLDICLPIHGILPMGRYLKARGYAYQPSSRAHLLFDAAAVLFSSSHRPIRGGQSNDLSGNRATHEHPKSHHDPGYEFSTFDFVRPIPTGLPPTYGSHVQLIAVTCGPMEFIINNFHSTGVMNVLAATHAISLFPSTTFNKEETFACRDLSGYPGWDAPWIDKYRKRGFRVFVARDPIPPRVELVTWRRKVGDALTWILPYKRAGLNAKERTLELYSRYAFEVLGVSFKVAPAGAVLRVGPRLVYSSTAWIANPKNAKLVPTFYSTEMAAAFSEVYHVASDDESSVSNVDTDEGDTEEAD
ncbi:hypothetical protein LXA43DRAFT_905775 [Ganoderma leucocontextum]|nr:hypothetical protein LXA43DRAFT_905775 [Ganoderma leucocontextum]